MLIAHSFIIPEKRRIREAPPWCATKQEPPLPREELVLKVAKEIVVKFIEVGRLTPTTFPDTFKMVIDTVRQSLKD